MSHKYGAELLSIFKQLNTDFFFAKGFEIRHVPSGKVYQPEFICLRERDLEPHLSYTDKPMFLTTWARPLKEVLDPAKWEWVGEDIFAQGLRQRTEEALLRFELQKKREEASWGP